MYGSAPARSGAAEVGLVAGLRHDGHVAWVDHRERQVRRAPPSSRSAAAFRWPGSNRKPKRRSHPARRRLAERGQALLEAVLAVVPDSRSAAVIASTATAGGGVSLSPGAEVDDVHPGFDEPPLDGGDLGQGIARAELSSRLLKLIISVVLSRTGLERMPTPGISTSTTSPSLQRGGAGRRAGGDEIARLQGHDPAEERHQLGNREVHVGGRRPLPLRAVDPADQLQRPPVEPGRPLGARPGQKVSKPLARPHWPSVFCRSRQVTSLTQT